MSTKEDLASESPSDPQAPRTRVKPLTKVLRVTGAVVSILGVAYWIQPYQYDLIAAKTPANNPPVNPDSKHLFSPNARVVFVTAHPDDAEFYAGGFLTKMNEAGTHVSLVILTDGGKSWNPFANHAKEAEIRRGEALRAAQAWHAEDVRFLGYSDSRLPDTKEVETRVEEALSDLHPDYVVSFDPEYPPRVSHRDHRTAGRVTSRAWRQVPGIEWHLMFESVAPNFAVNIDKEWDVKKQLIAIHKSEFSGEKLNRILDLLENRATDAAEMLNGATYAEAFRVEKR
jgi:LmbE family N-acetylglucosaminyl deacetylase